MSDEEITQLLERSQKKLAQNEADVNKLLSEIDALARNIEKQNIEQRTKEVAREGIKKLDEDFVALISDLEEIRPGSIL